MAPAGDDAAPFRCKLPPPRCPKANCVPSAQFATHGDVRRVWGQKQRNSESRARPEQQRVGLKPMFIRGRVVGPPAPPLPADPVFASCNNRGAAERT